MASTSRLRCRSGNPRDPGQTSQFTIEKIEANVPIDPAEFKMPASAHAASAPAKKEY